MKITIKHYGNKHSWKSEHDGQDLTEVAQQIKGLLVAVGFHPSSVDEHFSPDTHEWFPDEDESKDVKARSDWEDVYRHDDYNALNGYGSECPPGMIKVPKLDEGDCDCIPDLPPTPIPQEVDFDGTRIMMSDPPKDKKT